MPWFKVDDGLPAHRKVLSIPRGQRRLAAVGAWTLVGAWCSANSTDGAFGPEVLDELGIPSKTAKDLVTAGMWHHEDPQHVMHDFLDYNPSRIQVNAERAAAADRQRKAREKARERREQGIAS